MLILIYLFLLGSIFLIALFFFRLEPPRSSTGLNIELSPKPASSKGALIKTPLFITRPLLPINRIILSRLKKQKTIDRLSSAELNMLPEDFLGIKELLIAGSLFAAFLNIKNLEPIWIAGIVLAGFLLPDIYLNIRIKKRNRSIIRHLPDVIDLLTLCVGGGLDFMQGVEWAIQRAKPSPLVKELSIVINEIKVGKSRQEALKSMSRRLNLPEVFSFVNTLVAADRMGTPVYDVLNSLGEETRRQRFQRGERLALQAPIKMLFPLIFFILPVVAIIVGGPILLQFLKGGLASGLGSF